MRPSPIRPHSRPRRLISLTALPFFPHHGRPTIPERQKASSLASARRERRRRQPLRRLLLPAVFGRHRDGTNWTVFRRPRSQSRNAHRQRPLLIHPARRANTAMHSSPPITRICRRGAPRPCHCNGSPHWTAQSRYCAQRRWPLRPSPIRPHPRRLTSHAAFPLLRDRGRPTLLRRRTPNALASAHREPMLSSCRGCMKWIAFRRQPPRRGPRTHSRNAHR